MDLTSIIVNSFCILILIVLLIGIRLNIRRDETTEERFTLILYSTLAYFVLNVICELFEGRHDLRALSYFFNFLDFIAIDLTILAFSYYLAALLGKEGPVNERCIKYTVITVYFDMVLILVLTLAGKLFIIENGYYVEGTLISIPYLVEVIVMLELITAVLQNRKLLSARQFTVVLVYLSLPVLPILLELFTDLYYLTSMAVTLSVILVYVLIQATEIEERRIKERMLEEVSTTDLLTGLSNRRSYYDAISKLNPEQNLGVLFCDINGLKTTNDRFGHQAGDELIKKFAEQLKNNYRKEEAFRISGDEFVVLVPNLAEHDFNRRLIKFKSDIMKSGDIASVGSSFGNGSRIDFLISAAENSMYSDKKAFYERTNSPKR